MSKSKGEFLTVSLLEEKGYLPLAYRMFCLQSHYRKPLEFSFEVLDNVTVAYEKLVKRIAELADEGEVDKEALECIFRSLELVNATFVGEKKRILWPRMSRCVKM